MVGAGWSACCIWNARIEYAAPTSGVYVVEVNYQLHDAVPMLSTNGGITTTNGWMGMNWCELNTSPWVSFNVDGTNYSKTGFYTNNAAGTNTILFPVPIWDVMFFRMKRIQ
jgi:hypothetical protein